MPKVNSGILQFTPRQVVLSSKQSQYNMKQENSSNNKILVLNAERKTLLFRSIARYLEQCSFSKTLKKFCKEANIQKDDLSNSAYDLEEMFSNFLEMRNDATENSKVDKVKDLQTNNDSGRGGECDLTSVACDRKKKKTSKTNQENPTHDTLTTEGKSKEKKKNKKQGVEGAKSAMDNATQHPIESKDAVLEESKSKTEAEVNDKLKDKKKKKKKDKPSADLVIDDEKPKKIDGKGEFKTPEEDDTEKQEKAPKKRKRVAPEEDAQAADEEQVKASKQLKPEKSKRRKTEESEEPKVKGQSTEFKSSGVEEKPRREENSEIGSGEAQKLSAKQDNGLSSASAAENGEKSSLKKSKQQNGSVETKSVKHFQRIKVDEMVFSDERLKDNSYWAKDGADTGYGAKAQEILGQVRGRDFRHEKTKKKRGTYRGGPIDLNSHSVKFNYSDDD